MSPTLELWVEGPTDASNARTGNDEQPIASRGALVPLVRKAIESEGGALPKDAIRARRLQGQLRGITKLGDGNRRRKLSIKGWKVLAAIDKAFKDDPNGLILAVWDRDGEETPLQDRDFILDALRERGRLGAAVGICVEEVEAWLLADAGAFKRCFGRGPDGGLPGKPENERDPKAMLSRILEDYDDIEDRASAFFRLAQAIELDTLSQKCPRGFDKLREAIREFIVPRLTSNEG